MIRFNFSFNVEDEISGEWLDFVHRVFIPAMTRSGLLQNAALFRLMQQEPQGQTFVLQFDIRSFDDLNRFKAHELEALLRELTEKFGDKVVFFFTEMEQINSR